MNENKEIIKGKGLVNLWDPILSTARDDILILIKKMIDSNYLRCIENLDVISVISRNRIFLSDPAFEINQS